MGPLSTVATSLLPSAEEATPFQLWSGTVFGIQVRPEFVEVYIASPVANATSLAPSADEATAFQHPSGAVEAVQVTPELLDV